MSLTTDRTLTRYISPPHGETPLIADGSEFNSPSHEVPPMLLSDVVVLDSLLYAEDRRLTPLLTTISQTAPTLLGPYATKSSKHTGQYSSIHLHSFPVHIITLGLLNLHTHQPNTSPGGTLRGFYLPRLPKGQYAVQ